MNQVIEPYNPQWPDMFQQISDFLKLHLRKHIRIEHVGSTSIPHMDAKPIIDIDIEISSERNLPGIIQDLADIGYTHVGDMGIPGREAFKRHKAGSTVLDKIDHHLYVCTSSNDEYIRHIRFRDTLRENETLANEYKAIKHEILNKVGYENRAAYVEMKENQYKDFFEKVLFVKE